MGSPDSSTFGIRPKRVAMRLATVVAALVGISLVLNALKLTETGVPEWLVDEFRLNNENNIPSFFSGAMLMATSVLCAISYKRERADASRASWSWAVMCAVFAFLAFDELFQVHERLSDPIRSYLQLPDALRFAWVVVYFGFALAAAALFWPAWRHLRPQVKRAFAAGGGIYVLGAAVFETIGGAIYTGAQGDIWYGLAYTVEETLEMLGLVIFLYGLLLLLGGCSIRFLAEPPAWSTARPKSEPDQAHHRSEPAWVGSGLSSGGRRNESA